MRHTPNDKTEAEKWLARIMDQAGKDAPARRRKRREKPVTYNLYARRRA